jgi:hypothetical protein
VTQLLFDAFRGSPTLGGKTVWSHDEAKRIGPGQALGWKADDDRAESASTVTSSIRLFKADAKSSGPTADAKMSEGHFSPCRPTARADGELCFDTHFAQRIPLKEFPVRKSEVQAPCKRSLELPVSHENHDRSASACQFDFAARFNSIDDLGKLRSRFRDRVSQCHTAIIPV